MENFVEDSQPQQFHNPRKKRSKKEPSTPPSSLPLLVTSKLSSSNMDPQNSISEIKKGRKKNRTLAVKTSANEKDVVDPPSKLHHKSKKKKKKKKVEREEATLLSQSPPSLSSKSSSDHLFSSSFCNSPSSTSGPSSFPVPTASVSPSVSPYFENSSSSSSSSSSPSSSSLRESPHLDLATEINEDPQDTLLSVQSLNNSQQLDMESHRFACVNANEEFEHPIAMVSDFRRSCLADGDPSSLQLEDKNRGSGVLEVLQRLPPENLIYIFAVCATSPSSCTRPFQFSLNSHDLHILASSSSMTTSSL